MTDTDYKVFENRRVYSTGLIQRYCDKSESWISCKTNAKNSGGYLQIGINKKMYRVHRLVAKLFLPVPVNEEMTQVNHIDEDKTNNHVTNLEWCTGSHNILHSVSSRKKQERRWTNLADYTFGYDEIMIPCPDIVTTTGLITCVTSWGTVIVGNKVNVNVKKHNNHVVYQPTTHHGRKWYSVAKLVLKYFKPDEFDEEKLVKHHDGNPMNNKIENLYQLD